MAMISRFLNKANKHLKSRKALGFLAILIAYVLIVDVNLEQRSILLQDHRELYRGLMTLDMGAGVCDIGSPTEDGNPAGVDTTKTLLVSYPGSGKRFTWTIIKALTNSEVADDWNFSGKLNEVDAPLTVKTSWPHREGVWSWGSLMDQVIFLIRDPSRAIPSYHNIRFELDYAETWAESYTNIPITYKERPAVDDWEIWRDRHFKEEMEHWIKMIEFWMRGGYDDGTESVHSRCENMDIDCHPKAIIDFDHFYQPGANSDFLQLCNVLDDSLQGSETVSVISSQIRACVLSQVFENPELHQGGRPDAGTEYTFTLSQFDDMLRKVTELRHRVESAINDPNTLYEETTALELVVILNKYIQDIAAKRYLSTETIVEQAAALAFGTATCTDIIAGTTERNSCDYMTNMASHAGVLASAYQEETFPYEDYLQDRADVVIFYNSNGGTQWANRDGWLQDGDHCSWANIVCNEDHRIESMSNPNSLLAPSSDRDSLSMSNPNSLLAPSDYDSLGYGVYLPDQNTKYPLTNTHALFVVGDCANIEDFSTDTNTFTEYDSMNSFVSESATQIGVGGSFKSAVLSMDTSASVTTGQKSSITTTFHSTSLEITAGYKSATFKDSCKTDPSQLVDEVRQLFEALPLPIITDLHPTPLPDATWTAYMTFMREHGSHIIKENIFGSAFYQWESSISEESDIVQSMQAKACAEFEGINPGSITACAGFNETSRQKAMSKDTVQQKVVKGGNETLRDQLGTDETFTNDDLIKFLNSKNEAEQAISSTYEGIWDVLYEMYSPLCTENADEGCNNAQRAKLLQAAYNGFTAFNCKQQQVSKSDPFYQTMMYTNGTDINGLRDIQCWEKKTGCTTNDDCHVGGAGSVCYAYGAGAFDSTPIDGTEMPHQEYNTIVRGEESGGYDEGINLSCYYDWGCTCHSDWTGGQLDRYIWASSSV